MQGGMGGDYQAQMMNYYVSFILPIVTLFLTIDICLRVRVALKGHDTGN